MQAVPPLFLRGAAPPHRRRLELARIRKPRPFADPVPEGSAATGLECHCNCHAEPCRRTAFWRSTVAPRKRRHNRHAQRAAWSPWHLWAGRSPLACSHAKVNATRSTRPEFQSPLRRASQAWGWGGVGCCLRRVCGVPFGTLHRAGPAVGRLSPSAGARRRVGGKAQSAGVLEGGQAHVVVSHLWPARQSEPREAGHPEEVHAQPVSCGDSQSDPLAVRSFLSRLRLWSRAPP